MTKRPKTRSPARAVCSLRARLRVMCGTQIALGPGKADLLEAIASTGELRRAAGELGMSYMRAWKLAQTMNRAFRLPVVETVRGGARHGAARLTATGRTILDLYREMEKESLCGAEKPWRRLRRHLRR